MVAGIWRNPVPTLNATSTERLASTIQILYEHQEQDMIDTTYGIAQCSTISETVNSLSLFC